MTDTSLAEQPGERPTLYLRVEKDGIHLGCEACGELASWPVNDILDAGEEPSRIVLQHLYEKHKDLT